MPEFRYIAKELSGREVTGELTANSELDVISQLSGKQLFPMKIQPAKATGVQRVGWVRRPRAGQLATFF
ncbi:MAG TPA: type II secretion system F family protein, partial [Planctomycetaceae bacterium]|nr:type II secretion system F family protein [Planctomycetaceae bacterium]